MQIREARPADFPRLVEQGREFWKQTRYPDEGLEYDPEQVHQLLEYLTTDDNGFVLVVRDEDDEPRGHALVIITPHIFHPATKAAMELAYYIEPEYRGHGGQLLRRVEQVCADKGVRYLSMIAMESSMPETVGAIYEKRGFTKTETTYTKDLGNA